MTLTKSPRSVAIVRRIISKLQAQHPGASTELNYRNAYELLVATILSAQCTDKRVNTITPALFARYPDVWALSRATIDELEPQIRSTGFFCSKARSLSAMAAALVIHHDGIVPSVMADLLKLSGVGRKTANVVLGHALGVPGFPVDRHVIRVTNRLGIAQSDRAEIIEQQLCASLPPDKWTVAADTLILHGRRVCKPKPMCRLCHARADCPGRLEPTGPESQRVQSRKR